MNLKFSINRVSIGNIVSTYVKGKLPFKCDDFEHQVQTILGEVDAKLTYKNGDCYLVWFSRQHRSFDEKMEINVSIYPTRGDIILLNVVCENVEKGKEMLALISEEIGLEGLPFTLRLPT